MRDFFEPPARAPASQQPGGAPPWTGRPLGPPPGEVLRELVLARSKAATIWIEYLDAYPQGFELKIRARTDIAYWDLARADGPPDVFGRHWPMAGEPRDSLPPQLLRVGVQFADGRRATSISGHDLPVRGPIMWALRGGGRGGADGSCFDQGYWVSPLPPPGPVTVACQWPAAEVPLAGHEVDARLIRDGAERSRALFPGDRSVVRDGRRWPLGGDADVFWINSGTAVVTSITAAIPPVFESYCTLLLPTGDGVELAVHERAVIELLIKHTSAQPWWLGYLDTGARDVVFPYAPRTELYCGYPYVLVAAGSEQATGWREHDFKGALPDLMFPGDRSWLLSTMWDDDWTSIGGSEGLIGAFLRHPALGARARRVTPGQDATPPGHTAR
ncbi:MAG TPA: hypothetical protein VKV27_03735 [Solirubrobacteraceae bacterium]|nr:hypothetical protein [Solirubrobacteraceae bacterium]